LLITELHVVSLIFVRAHEIVLDLKAFELAVFVEFSNVAPFTVVPGSIQQPPPPLPDIACEIDGIGKVAFELTELIDSSFQSRLDLMFKTKEYYSKYWKEELSADERKDFEAKYEDALLHLVFRGNVGLIERRRLAPQLFSELLRLPNGGTGTFLRRDSRLFPNFEEARIRRGTFVGPIIDIDSFGWIGDPTEPAITRKLRKSYPCNCPLHLLAHIEINVLPPEGAWKAAARDAVDLLEGSQFEKIWVYDRTSRTIEFERSA